MPLKDIQLKNITDWKVLTYPESIEEMLIKWNIIHLEQTEGTLFTRYDIVKYIGKTVAQKVPMIF